MILEGQTHSLSPEQIKQILGYTLLPDLAPAVSLFRGHWVLLYLDSGICRLSQAFISAS
jgi:hypothetical protein